MLWSQAGTWSIAPSSSPRGKNVELFVPVTFMMETAVYVPTPVFIPEGTAKMINLGVRVRV